TVAGPAKGGPRACQIPPPPTGGARRWQNPHLPRNRFRGRSKDQHLVSPMPATARAHHQLRFGSGGYTGTAGMKPLRFGISTFGRLWASITSVSPTMPFRYNRNAVSE